MKSELATAPGRLDHPPQPVSAVDPRPARRVGLLDRAALRLGVALVTWGRRPVRRARPTVSHHVLDNRRRLDDVRDTHQVWGADLTRLR